MPVTDINIISTRFARDKNGKGIQVNENMTYEQWKKEFDIK